MSTRSVARRDEESGVYPREFFSPRREGIGTETVSYSWSPSTLLASPEQLSSPSSDRSVSETNSSFTIPVTPNRLTPHRFGFWSPLTTTYPNATATGSEASGYTPTRDDLYHVSQAYNIPGVNPLPPKLPETCYTGNESIYSELLRSQTSWQDNGLPSYLPTNEYRPGNNYTTTDERTPINVYSPSITADYCRSTLQIEPQCPPSVAIARTVSQTNTVMPLLATGRSPPSAFSEFSGTGIVDEVISPHQPAAMGLDTLQQQDPLYSQSSQNMFGGGMSEPQRFIQPNRYPHPSSALRYPSLAPQIASNQSPVSETVLASAPMTMPNTPIGMSPSASFGGFSNNTMNQSQEIVSVCTSSDRQPVIPTTQWACNGQRSPSMSVDDLSRRQDPDPDPDPEPEQRPELPAYTAPLSHLQPRRSNKPKEIRKGRKRLSDTSHHPQIEAESGIFKCTCGTHFHGSRKSAKNNLSRHIASSMRQIPCKSCDKSFSRADNLKSHQRTHGTYNATPSNS